MSPDLTTFLDVLFRPGEIFEIRVKESETNRCFQYWLSYNDREKLERHLPIHESHKRDVWIGVVPRTEYFTIAVTSGHVLWTDFKEGITNGFVARRAISKANLPPATIIIQSGSGVHGYWQLSEAVRPDHLGLCCKAIHELLPTDRVFDTKRVMRLPETWNWKTKPARLCWLEDYQPGNVYDISLFPVAEVPAEKKVEPTSYKTLPPEWRDAFVGAWIQGQRNYLAVGVAGFLRKYYGYSQDEAEMEIASIHEEAGYSLDDVPIDKIVRNTYKKPLSKIASYSILDSFGATPVKTKVRFKNSARSKSASR